MKYCPHCGWLVPALAKCVFCRLPMTPVADSDAGNDALDHPCGCGG